MQVMEILGKASVVRSELSVALTDLQQQYLTALMRRGDTNAAIPVYEQLYATLSEVPQMAHSMATIERLSDIARMGVELLPGWALSHARLGETLLLRIDKDLNLFRPSQKAEKKRKLEEADTVLRRALSLEGMPMDPPPPPPLLTPGPVISKETAPDVSNGGDVDQVEARQTEGQTSMVVEEGRSNPRELPGGRRGVSNIKPPVTESTDVVPKGGSASPAKRPPRKVHFTPCKHPGYSSPPLRISLLATSLLPTFTRLP
jgi:hypothetical protein